MILVRTSVGRWEYCTITSPVTPSTYDSVAGWGRDKAGLVRHPSSKFVLHDFHDFFLFVLCAN
jgi:hypothetical protein